jgi:glutathionylspermidine synthase
MLGAARENEPLVARFDFFLCEEGLKVSEFNTDVCAGINETQGLYDLYLRKPGLFDATRNLIEMLLPPSGGTVGFMYPTGYSDDFEQTNYLRSCLQRLGVKTVYGSPANFVFDGSRLSAFGQPVDVLYRYFLADWMQELPNLANFIEGYRRGAFRMVNGFGQLVCQTKKVMAFWYDHLDRFTPEERKLIKTHVPFTQLYSRRKAERRRRHVAVKRGFGNMGNEVVLGPLLNRDEFLECLDAIDQEPNEWVIQDFFNVIPDAGGMYPCYGAYMIDGKFSGYYTRLAPEPFICYTARVAATDYED